jgi:glutaredoxin
VLRFTLFHTPGCGYCHLVRREASRLGIELDLVDIYEQPAARQRLLAWRGRSTVPVLEIPGPNGPKLMPESADIIAYLKREAQKAA